MTNAVSETATREDVTAFFSALFPKKARVRLITGERDEHMDEVVGKRKLFPRPLARKAPTQVLGLYDKYVDEERQELFFAPVPHQPGERSKQSGKPIAVMPNKSSALDGWCIFADADNGLDEEDRDFLRRDLDATLVRSGGESKNGPRYHVYVPLDSATPPETIERLNRGLCKLVNGDTSKCHAATDL